MLSLVGFLYVAIRVQTKKFWVAAAIGSAGSALVWIVMALSGDLDETSETASAASSADSTGDWGSGVAIAVWAALLVFAIVLNRDYLRWRAGHSAARAWYNQPVGNPTSAPVSHQPHTPNPDFLGVDQSDYYAVPPAPRPSAHPGPSWNTAPARQPAATYGHPTAQSQPAGPVDVNTATAEALARSLGIDHALASRVVTVRDSRDGFSNLDDLVAAAGLQPHELLKFRDRVTFGTRTTRPTSPPPSAPQAPSEDRPSGRILDI
jgi:hypothetical protein